MDLRGNRLFKSFPSEDGVVPVVSDVSLNVRTGQFITLYGPNGCGKSTLLNLLSGLIQPDSGEVNFEGRVAYCPQDFAEVLLPWESAIDNISFPLRARGATRKDARMLASDFLDRFQICLPHSNFPYQLSVGQQQMVALARTLIQDAGLVLLDEPLSALDYRNRLHFQRLLRNEISRTNRCLVAVSHDIDEAIYLSDVVIVLSPKPTRILDRLEVSFPIPRLPEIVTTPEFAAVRSSALSKILEFAAP